MHSGFKHAGGYSTIHVNMATRSYAGPEWLLFIRTDGDSDRIVATAVSTRGKNVVAERMVDETALLEHVRLGVM